MFCILTHASYNVLHTMCFIQCASSNVLHTMCFIQCASYNVLHPMFFIQCASSNVLHTMCFIQCASYNVLHPMCFIQCASYNVLHTMYLLNPMYLLNQCNLCLLRLANFTKSRSYNSHQTSYLTKCSGQRVQNTFHGILNTTIPIANISTIITCHDLITPVTQLNQNC